MHSNCHHPRFHSYLWPFGHHLIEFKLIKQKAPVDIFVLVNQRFVKVLLNEDKEITRQIKTFFFYLYRLFNKPMKSCINVRPTYNILKYFWNVTGHFSYLNVLHIFRFRNRPSNEVDKKSEYNFSCWGVLGLEFVGFFNIVLEFCNSLTCLVLCRPFEKYNINTFEGC